MTIDARTIIGTAARSVSFEGLEHRQLMSGVGFASNTLTITGTTKSDDIRVSLSSDGKTISAKLNNGTTQNFKAADVYKIKVDADEGHNRITFDSRITAEADIEACDGNDTITTGAGNDRIRSAGGNDVINAGAGHDYVEAAGGNDRIDLGAGNDKAVAGDGNDTVLAGLGKDAMLGQGGDDALTGESIDTFDGGTGKNTISKAGSTSTGGSTSNNGSTTTPVVKATVRKLSLVNADTGAVISGYGTLTNGMTLDLSKLPKNITILAEVDGKVESAKFSLSDGSAGRIDDSSGYSLTSPKGGAYQAWSMSTASSVKISVTPYSADGAQGTAGTTTSMTLNVKRAAVVNPTPKPNPTPAPTPLPTPTPAATGAPKVTIKSIQTTVTAGQAYHGEATQTVVPGYQAEDASFSWDFGDANGEHNVMPGFNAAHVYETPGNYSAKLTVTSPSGQSTTQTVNVNVVASNLKTVYVAASGNDSNNGSSQGEAVKTLAKAVSLGGSNSQILLKRGDTFPMSSSVTVSGSNVTISSYGSGSKPVLFYSGARSGNPVMVGTAKSAKNITIRGLTFNSAYPTNGEQEGMPHAISAGGTAITVRDNTFLNLGYAVNANAQPTGLLVMNNDAPLATGLRGYFVWTEGTDIVIVNNKIANSTREHIVRAFGADRINVAFNDFTNLNRSKQGDAGDNAKGTVVMQKGSFTYVAYNELRGPVGVGPLGQQDGLTSKGSRFKHAAFEGNTVYGMPIDVHHGAENITIRGNTSYVNDGTAIKIEAYSNTYGRGVRDVVVDHNVGINTSTTGNFIIVQGDVDGITLTNNVYVAPILKAGAYNSGGLHVMDNNLDSFRRIDNNVWPAANRGLSWARGGMAVLGTGDASANYRTPSEWNAMGKVGTDQFNDVSLDNVGAYAMKITSQVTSAKLRLAA